MVLVHKEKLMHSLPPILVFLILGANIALGREVTKGRANIQRTLGKTITIMNIVFVIFYAIWVASKLFRV